LLQTQATTQTAKGIEMSLNEVKEKIESYAALVADGHESHNDAMGKQNEESQHF
jgi:hypothetical protein